MRQWLLLFLLALPLSLAAGVYETVITYPSVDQHGEPVMLSGKVSVPTGKEAKGVMLVLHYTIGANKEVPSSCTPYEAKQFRKDYVLIMPDYIGYGATKDRFPPYLHGALTAQNSVDMIPYAQRVLDSLQYAIRIDSLFVIGFSQGAEAALWTLKLLEEQYSTQYHVTHCFIGSGPYNVAATYDNAVSSNKVGMPMAVPLLVMGTSVSYDLNLSREQLFTPYMDKRFDELIASKKHGLMDLFMRMPKHNLSAWLSDTGRDKTQPETQRLYEGLLRSSLLHDGISPAWTPKAPLYVFHSTQDDVVTFHCAEHLQNRYPNEPNITYDFGPYGSHLKSLFKFFSRVKEQL